MTVLLGRSRCVVSADQCYQHHVPRPKLVRQFLQQLHRRRPVVRDQAITQPQRLTGLERHRARRDDARVDHGDRLQVVPRRRRVSRMIHDGRPDRLAAVQRDRVVVPGGGGPVGLRLQMVRRRQRHLALRAGVHRLAVLPRLDAEAAERRLLQGHVALRQQPEVEVDHVHALLLPGA